MTGVLNIWLSKREEINQHAVPSSVTQRLHWKEHHLHTTRESLFFDLICIDSEDESKQDIANIWGNTLNQELST